MDPKSNGKVSVLSLVYILVTNMFGVLLALALFFSFNIGKYSTDSHFIISPNLVVCEKYSIFRSNKYTCV